MTNIMKKIMVSACKNRIKEGKTWDEIHKIYPRLSDEELEEIKNSIDDED